MGLNAIEETSLKRLTFGNLYENTYSSSMRCRNSNTVKGNPNCPRVTNDFCDKGSPYLGEKILYSC